MTDLLIALTRLDIEYPDVPEIDVSRLDVAKRESRGTLPGGRRSRWSEAHSVGGRLRWAIALGATALTVITTIAPVREAVADWLGLGVIEIEEVAVLPEGLEDTIGDLGEPIRVEDAGSWPALLGTPDAAYAASDPASVSMVWLPGQALPEVGSTGVGALFSRFDGSVEVPVITKAAAPGTEIRIVRVDGQPAYWLSGAAHAFGYISGDDVAIETLRLAGDTLLWEVDGVTFRLESALSLEEAIELAESVGS
jgi:Fe2+ transport system protein FeoA